MNDVKRVYYTDGCQFCRDHATELRVPPHDASERCESGGHSHCGCDRCF